MDAEAVLGPSSDAASGGESYAWLNVDWEECAKTVRRLQARIVEAVLEGNWRKVSRLQWLLTNSRAAKALAVRKVVGNRGKKTPGVDKVLWDTPEKKRTAVVQLQRHGYQPKPLKRTYVPKPNGKRRPLGIPTMYDRAMQALHLFALDPVVETQSDPNSYGFRQNRAAMDAIAQLHNVLHKQGCAEWVLEADIEGCFDNIDHNWLLKQVRMDRRILKMWLDSGYIEQGCYHKTEAGTPQGGIISPALCNVTLNGIESGLEAFLRNGKTQKAYEALRVHVIRYADDFVITGVSKELLENEVMPWIEQFLAERGLNLQKAKTRVVHICDGFDFLGFNIRKYVRKSGHFRVLTKPSKKALKACWRRLREIVRKHRSSSQGELIDALNRFLVGWGSYFSAGVSQRVFEKLDCMLSYKLWQWARRRHPRKQTKWIKAKYWQPHGKRKLWFKCVDADLRMEGLWRWFVLFHLSSIKIHRHIKLPGDINPYDPRDSDRIAKILVRRLKLTTQGRKKLEKIIARQKGCCDLCGEPLWFQENAERCLIDRDFDFHHVVFKSKRGKANVSNLRARHITCHIQSHSLASTAASVEGQKEN